jgi:nucleotide-binding universal stress UspA family protein
MKILIATDGSDFSLQAIRQLPEIVNLGKTQSICLISVAEANIPANQFGITDKLLEVTKQNARRVAEKAVEEGRKVLRESVGQTKIETRTVVGNPKEKIVEEAGKWEADLIVVGSHGRGFWGRVLLGSISDAVLHHAVCSVLVVRQRETADKN